MPAIIPYSAPGFDRKNLEETVRALCGQFRLFQENVDFQLGQIRKDLEGRDDAQKEKIAALAQELAALKDRVKDLEERSEG